MASRQITLATKAAKEDATAASSGSASGNVIVQFDDAEDQLEIIVALQKVIEYIRENEY